MKTQERHSRQTSSSQGFLILRGDNDMKKIIMKFTVMILVAAVLASLAVIITSITVQAQSAPNYTNAWFRAEPNVRVNAFSAPGAAHNGWWFDYTSGDVRILGTRIHQNALWMNIRYPLFAGGTRDAWVPASSILQGNRTAQEITFHRTTQVYRNSAVRTRFGEAWSNQSSGYAWLIGSRNGNYQVIFRLAAGGHRIGFVRPGTFSIVGATSVPGGWQWPMNNVQVTADWQHRTNSPPAAGRTHHTGIDMVSSDTRVFAAAAGRVVQAGWNDANGNFVTIRHRLENGQHVYSFYAHLRDRTNSLLNQDVRRGQQIGVMGNTGRSTGAHLHFSISNSPGSNGNLVGWAAPGANNRATHGNITFFNPRFVIQNNRLP